MTSFKNSNQGGVKRMQIKSIVIVKTSGADHIMLFTDLIEACYPYTGKLVLSFEAAYNNGASYVGKIFPDVTDVKIVGRA